MCRTAYCGRSPSRAMMRQPNCLRTYVARRISAKVHPEVVSAHRRAVISGRAVYRSLLQRGGPMFLVAEHRATGVVRGLDCPAASGGASGPAAISRGTLCDHWLFAGAYDPV